MEQKRITGNRNILLDAGGGSKPVVRAMYANVYLFGGIGFFIIAVFLAITHSPYIVLEIFVVLTGMFFIHEYIHSIARIIIGEQNLIIILSLHEVIISREIIKSIKLHRLPIPTVLKIKIYGKGNGKKWIFSSSQFLTNADMEFMRSSWLIQ
jgi:hypothetical protein